MRNKKAVAFCAAIASVLVLTGAEVNAAPKQAQTVTEETKSEETTNKEQEREKRREKIQASMEKWDKLSKENKAKVYQLLEEKQEVNAKVLDQLVSLGVLNKEDASAMKQKRKDYLEKMKEEGRFPLGRPHSKKKENCNLH